MYTENKLQKFKFIEEGNLKSHRFKNILNSELPSVTQKQNIPIITGVSLCILSVVVLLVFGIFESFAASEYLSCFNDSRRSIYFYNKHQYR